MPELTDRINSSVHTSEDFAQKCRQEIYVLSLGTLGGAVKEFNKHPQKTICDTAGMGVAAVGLTAIAAAELPVVSIVAAGTGAVYSAKYAWNLIDPQSPHNIERNLSIQKAMATAWTTSDKGTLQNSILELQDKIGPDSLQVFQSLAVGGAATKYGVRTVDMVYGAARLQPLTLATDAVTINKIASANTKVPTWDEYVNFMRRHGPVTQKSIRQFELEQLAETATKNEAKENYTGANDEDKAASKHSTQKSESTKSLQEQKHNHSLEHEKQEHEEENTSRGSSLYFGERFGHFHH